MGNFFQKVIKNVRQGTLFRNGSRALNNRWKKYKKYNRFTASRNVFCSIHKMLLNDFQGLDGQQTPYGNYFLHNAVSLTPQSVVYSLGVGEHVEFDLAIAEKIGCPVYMYDPTPESLEFMKGQTNPHFRFFPFGVWNHPSELNFYTPPWGGSSSIFPFEKGQSPNFVAQCDRLPTFMAQNRHTHIDVLKMDIEGAGLVVLKDLLAHEIYPTQLVMELERPKEENVATQIPFFADILAVLQQLRTHGYTIYQIPQKGLKYYSFEFLCVKL